MKKLLLTFLCTLVYLSGMAGVLSENAKIYLLTCQPGTEVYGTFGHSALYVEDRENGIDYVFNYGIFSFNTDNFLYKFVKGETYYMVDIESFSYFLRSYAQRKVGVYAQPLNLTADDKERLFDALMTNALPENKVYLYNFFYDNCATRLRDMVEKNVGEAIVFPEAEQPQTFRHLIEQYTGQNTWLKFGIDILVGAPADNVATEYEKMFLPDMLRDDFDKSFVVRDGGVRTPLALPNSGEQLIPNFPRTGQSSGIFSPISVMWIVFVVALLISICGFVRKKACFFFDFVLFFITGLIGLLVFYISFISIHPAVFPNYNILWLHPLQLVFAFCLLFKRFRPYSVYYHYFNLALLVVAFILSSFAQCFHPGFYPLMLTLVVRSVFGVKVSQTNKTTER